MSVSVVPDCCLARVVRVTGTRRIEKAESIQVYLIPGWQAIDKIGAYQVGDLVIYCMINTVFPSDFAPTSFLKGERLKTKKMLGELSQGLLLPLTVVSRPVTEDEDLTAELKLRKWVPPAEFDQYDAQDGATERVKFPDFIPKTDEDRVQNCTKIIPRLAGVPVTMTIKRDGTSTSYVWFQGKFLVGGRNYLHLAAGAATGHYFAMAKKYDLARKMTDYGKNIAIQGEITGPKLNGNRHGLKEEHFHVFNIYSVDESRYLPWDQVVEICTLLDLPLVRVVFRGVLSDDQLAVDYFLKLAEEQRYENDQPAEGIVIKSDNGPRISFKAISNKYLIKHGL